MQLVQLLLQVQTLGEIHQIATFSDYLVSGETFTGTAGGSNSDPAVVFANISASSGGSTTQAAAITNRSGWL